MWAIKIELNSSHNSTGSRPNSDSDRIPLEFQSNSDRNRPKAMLASEIPVGTDDAEVGIMIVSGKHV